MSIQKFIDSTAVPQEYYLAPDKLISGNPKQILWMHYTDASKKFFSGVWQSEVGKWRVSYTEEEYCCILEGTSVITKSSSSPVTVTVGESFVIPSGFVGTWEVVTPTKKTFVIYEQGN
jgi:uncharacterized cupin superfamily protein